MVFALARPTTIAVDSVEPVVVVGCVAAGAAGQQQMPSVVVLSAAVAGSVRPVHH